MKKPKTLKQPKTFEEQLSILKNRHMIIENDQRAIKILAETNYYRLTAYALRFKKDDDYNNQITFDTMYKLYQFDKKLRNILLGILETIEISLRTYVAYSLSIEYGAEAHKNPDAFRNKEKYTGYKDKNGNYHRGLLDEIETEIFRNRKELSVKHHIEEYDKHFPIWVIVEILSFGMLSRMYENLQTKQKKKISRNGFNTNYEVLGSCVRSLSFTRNVCAHYGRIYDRKLRVMPKINEKYNKYNIKLDGLFATILSIKELTSNRTDWNTFKIELEALIDEYSNIVSLDCMGFPNEWRKILQQ